MKKIASRLKEAAYQIEQRLAADVNRAKGYKACAKLTPQRVHGPTMKLIRSVEARTKKEILKSVLVCNDKCLTVSFAKQLGSLRKVLGKAAGQAQAYAKNVVQCAGVKHTGGVSGGTRTDDSLNSIVNDTNRIVSNCKVCPH